MLEILDSLIATIAVVLVLSLIVQAIQQIIKQAWSFKSKYMERELLAMFLKVEKFSTESDSQQGWLKRLWTALQDFIKPARMEFKDVVDKKGNKDLVGLFNEVKTRLAAIGYNDISLLETMTKKDFIKLLQNIQIDSKIASSVVTKAIDDAKQWYDHTLKAFQAHYESRMKSWSYALAGIVVVWLNANIFDIHKEFASNKVLRDSAVKMAEQLAATPRAVQLVTKDSMRVAGSAVAVADSAVFDAIKKQIARIDSLVSDKSYHVMRWNTPGGDSLRWRCAVSMIKAHTLNDSLPTQDSVICGKFCFVQDAAKATIDNLFGWLVMTLLVGLGAPFWYDLLKTVMGLKESLKNKKQNVTDK